MPEISEEDAAEFNRLRSESVTQGLDLAKANFRAENPHIPASLLESWQGDPADLPKFGESLLTQFPKPVVPPVTAAVAAEVPPPAAVPAAPAAGQLVVPPAPIPGPAPAPVSTVPPPLTPEAYARAYNEAAAQGRPLQTLEQMQQAARQPAAPVPSPGMGDVLTPQNAQSAQSETIRERMRIGTATPAEAQWLAQNGDKGFVAAVTGHARKVRQAVGSAQ